jgi:hypothetical protein
LKETDAGKIDVSRGQALDTAGALLVLVANTDGRNNAVASEAIPGKMMRGDQDDDFLLTHICVLLLVK